MTEQVLTDSQVHDEGGLHWDIPYDRLEDITPTPTNPAAVLAEGDGPQAVGWILSIDAGATMAVIDFSVGSIRYVQVRNVLTYSQSAENTWGAIDIGDNVYYDRSATMPAGVYLSTSPLDDAGANNPRFGRVVSKDDTDEALYPKGGGTASTQTCGVACLGLAGGQ